MKMWRLARARLTAGGVFLAALWVLGAAGVAQEKAGKVEEAGKAEEAGQLAKPLTPVSVAQPPKGTSPKAVAPKVVAPKVITPSAKSKQVKPAKAKPAKAKPAEAEPSQVKPAAADPTPVERSAAESAVPVAYGLPRYESIWSNSPFMLETPLNTVVEESWARDLAVTSVSVIQGKTRVGYVNTKTRETNSATDQGPNSDGVLVASVQGNANPSKVLVELSRGGERAKVTFDEMTLQGKATAPKVAAQPRPGTPGASGRVVPGGVPGVAGQRPAGFTQRTPSTRRRIVLPKSVTAPKAQPPAGQQPPTRAAPPFLQQQKKAR